MKAILFRGYRKTGKTSLITAAIGALVRRGHRVVAVKHSPHLHLAESGGGDSGLFFQAGTAESLLLAADGALRISRWETNEPIPFEELIGESTSGLTEDYALIEGYKSYRGPIPNVAFGRNPQECAGLVLSSTVGWAGWFLSDPDERERSRSRTGLPLLFPGMEEELLADFIEDTALPPPAR